MSHWIPFSKSQSRLTIACFACREEAAVQVHSTCFACINFQDQSLVQLGLGKTPPQCGSFSQRRSSQRSDLVSFSLICPQVNSDPACWTQDRNHPSPKCGGRSLSCRGITPLDAALKVISGNGGTFEDGKPGGKVSVDIFLAGFPPCSRKSASSRLANLVERGGLEDSRLSSLLKCFVLYFARLLPCGGPANKGNKDGARNNA